MNQARQPTFLDNPTFRIVSTWVWWFIGAALTTVVILAIEGTDFASAMEVLGKRVDRAVYVEIVAVGLLPVLFTLICRDDLAQYGLHRKGLAKSLLLSLAFVTMIYGWAYISRGQLMSDSRPDPSVPTPWNLWYGLLGIFAWGPLEVFFIAWLIRNTDRIFKTKERVLSWGLIITVVIFALAHVVTTNLSNALYTGAIFLTLGLIYKYTRNSIGPMLAWTLVNGQVWYVARLLI